MSEITGYAAVFNSETVIAGAFRERIAPGAFTGTIARDDIRAAFNHNPDMVLGRTSARTAEVSQDAKGLRYRVEVNTADPMAIGAAARIERRDVTGSSFWFAIDSPDDEEWTIDDPKKLPLRTLKKLRLIDVGPVSYPAYEAASSMLVTRTEDDSIAERERLQKQITQAKAWREPKPVRRSAGFRLVGARR